MKTKKSKRSQSEVITTVLLVLIGIVAVGLLSAWVVNFVNGSLKNSACRNLALTDVTINTEEAITFFNLTSNVSFVVIERSQNDFNLSGVNVIIGNDIKSPMYKIREGNLSNVCEVTSGMTCTYNTFVHLPGLSNPKVTYMINSANDFKGSKSANKISVVPVLTKSEIACNDVIYETNMPTYP
jgi:flagellin-like protein